MQNVIVDEKEFFKKKQSCFGRLLFIFIGVPFMVAGVIGVLMLFFWGAVEIMDYLIGLELVEKYNLQSTYFDIKTNDLIAFGVFGLFALLLLFLGVFLPIRLAVKRRKKRKTAQDLVSGVEMDFGEATDNPNSIAFQTNKGALNLNNVFRGVLVLGGNGSGKSESIAVPMLKQFIEKGFSGLIYDFKFPTLAQEVQTFLEPKNGLKHYYIDFLSPLNSYRVNPLNPKYLTNSSFAREYAETLVSNLAPESIEKKDYWIRSATDLLTACIWFLRKKHPYICDIPHVLSLVCSNDEKLLKLLSTDVETEQMTISMMSALERNAGNQLSGVIGTLQSVAGKINTPDLMYVLGGDDFSLDLNNPEEPKLLTLGTSPTLVTAFAPLCALIISVCSKVMNQPNKNKSFMLIDEAPTVFVPNIEVLPNTARSNKIATVLMGQDISQFQDSYGTTKADVLFSSCNNHFYGRINSSKTAQLLSNQLGKHDVYEQSYNIGTSQQHTMQGGASDSRGVSYSIKEKEVMKASEFLELNTGEIVSVTVESNIQKLRAQYSMIEREVQTLEPPQVKHYADTEAYFLQVREDIKRILG